MVAIMEATAESKTCVWRWQERFMTEGVDWLLRDKSRLPGTAPLEVDLIDRVVALTQEPARAGSHSLEGSFDGKGCGDCGVLSRQDLA